MHATNKRIHFLAGIATAALIASARPSLAAATPQQIDLPQQGLADELRAIARLTGRDIMFASDAVGDRPGKPLHGMMSADQAVDHLLAGSNLTADHREDGILIRGRSDARQADATASEPSSDIVVTGSRIRGAPSASPTIVLSQTQIEDAGHARFSFADNDLLISSSTGFSQSARSDTSTKFEAGKQAGPDTIEHFLGGGAEGHAAMARWLQGGFEMDRHGNWRLKPQVADTLERDVTAIMSQTGWQRSLARSADHQTGDGQTASANLTGTSTRGTGTRKGGSSGTAAGTLGIDISDRGIVSMQARSTMDIVNYDVRDAIASAERAASRSAHPEATFAETLSERVLGNDGLRNRYMDDADAGRGTTQVTAPIMSYEQSSIVKSGRLASDREHGWGDGNPDFKDRRDR